MIDCSLGCLPATVVRACIPLSFVLSSSLYASTADPAMCASAVKSVAVYAEGVRSIAKEKQLLGEESTAVSQNAIAEADALETRFSMSACMEGRETERFVCLASEEGFSKLCLE